MTVGCQYESQNNNITWNVFTASSKNTFCQKIILRNFETVMLFFSFFVLKERNHRYKESR